MAALVGVDRVLNGWSSASTPRYCVADIDLSACPCIVMSSLCSYYFTGPRIKTLSPLRDYWWAAIERRLGEA